MESTNDQHVLRLATPQPFIETSTPFEDWNKWRERYELFEIGSEIATKSSNIRRASLLTILGSSAYETYKTFDFPSDQQEDTQTTKHILDAFTDYYKPYKNVTYASYEFNKLVQTADQPVMEFIKHLKISAEHCEFGLLKDRLIRDRVVIGIRDDVLRQRLLRETDPKLSQVIQMCLAAEISHIQGQAIVKSSTLGEPHIERIISARSRQPPARPRFTREGTANRGPTMTDLSTPKRPCSRCGSHHKPRNCPAYGKTCFNCGMQGHFSQVCRQPRVQELNTNNDILPTSIPTDDILYLDVLQLKGAPTTTTNTWLQDVEVNRTLITFKLDTGADVNLIPQRYINNWPTVHIVPTSQQILTYTGQSIPILGTCKLPCTAKGKTHVLHFVVAKLNAKPILGAEACVRMGFIQRIHAISEPTLAQKNAQDLIEKYDSVFTGQGRLPGTYHITLRPDASPVVVPARKVPIAVEPLLKKELQRMQDEGIITPVTQPTEWVNALVIVYRKDGRIRLCLDPRPLNKVILRQHFHLPSEEELLSKISGATIFTVLDASNGFWHLSLDEPSSLLCTFATPYGRYRFLVLPFGIASAPEMFQLAMVNVFSSEERLNPFFDDLLIAGLDSLDHDQLLERALQLSHINNLKLNKNKLQLAQPSVTYLGHVLTRNGLEADPAKVEAIMAYPTPKDVHELQRFLGMVTYLHKFIKNATEGTAVLRQLLQKDALFQWTPAHDYQFQQLQSAVGKAPILAYFQPGLPTILSVDASSYGLGAVLLQHNKPIAFASQALTQTQQLYAQIDKELLAIVYACEHFHFFVYGRPVEIHTDHKPLIGLQNKSFDKLSPRLQRLLLRLQRYIFKLTYVPGKSLAVADALSRAPTSPPTQSQATQAEESIHECLLVHISDARLQQMQDATLTDPVLQSLLVYIRDGWPSDPSKLIREAEPYTHCANELHVKDGLVCRGSRVVIPQSQRQEVLRQLHVSHRGLTSTQQHARETVYWPGITKDIHTMIISCEVCQRNRNHPAKEPLLDRPLPTRPWQHICADYFHLNSTTFLILADVFSKFIEVVPMTSTAAIPLIASCKTIYARYGFPEELLTDNGPPFDSTAVAAFHKKYAIRHITSSPLYPRSNGFIERCVQTIKNALIKARASGADLADVLLDYRTKPLSNGASPAELLMGRRLRSAVPMLPDLLEPRYDVRSAQATLRNNQIHQKRYGNQHTSHLPPLELDQPIWYWTGNNWNPAIVQSKSGAPRSYMIITGSGLILRRNRIHIRPRFPPQVPSTFPTVQPTTARAFDDDLPPPAPQDDSGIPRERSPQSSVPAPPETPTSRCGRPIVIPARFRE